MGKKQISARATGTQKRKMWATTPFSEIIEQPLL